MVEHPGASYYCCLFKKILDLVFPGLALRAVLGTALGGGFFKVTQQFFLLFRQFHRRFDRHVAEQVARVTRTHALDALAFQAESLARLGAFRNRERHLAVQGRHFDFAAQGCLGERNRHFAMQVVAFALEYGVRLDVDFHIQVTGRAAIRTRFAVAGRADAHAIVDTDRYFDFQRLVALDTACAAARRTRIGDDLAAAMAFRASLLDAEETLLHAHLAVAAARTASGRRGAWLGAAAVASIALVPARYADGGVEAVSSLLQRNFQVIAQVSATVHLWTRIAAASTATAKDVAKDIAKAVGKTAATKAATATAHVRVHACMTITVVCIALFRIGQHFVGFFDFLELFFRFLTVRIAVRMVLHRQFAVSLFDLFFRSIFCDTECLVKITLCHVVGTLQSIYWCKSYTKKPSRVPRGGDSARPVFAEKFRDVAYSP